MPGVVVLVGVGCLWVAVSYEEGRVILRICFVYVSYILRSGWGWNRPLIADKSLIECCFCKILQNRVVKWKKHTPFVMQKVKLC